LCGHAPGTARRAAWQLLSKKPNPRFSTLVALADALGVELKDLL
jgi:DNA-binding phage protein